MRFYPCPCTYTQSPQHDQEQGLSESQRIQFDSKSLCSQPSLPSVASLTSHSQPPSTTANHHYITTFKAHTSSIFSLALTGKHLLSASSDGQICIWPNDPSSSSSVSQSPPPPPIASAESSVKSMVVHGDRLFTGHQDHKIRVWKLDEKQEAIKCVATLPTLNDRLMKLVFAKNYVKIRRNQRCTWVHHVDAVSALAISKDGSLIYSGSWDRTFKVWRTTDFKCLESVWNAHDDAINAVVVSHNGYVYTGSADRKIKVWKRHGGENKHKLVDSLEKHKSAVNALALSTDGSVLYSGACDRSIIVWEKAGDGGDGRHMVVAGALRGHGKAILCITVVADMAFSGSADKTIRVWRRGIDGKSYLCLGVLEGHKSPVKCLAAAVEVCTSGSPGGTSYLVFGGSLDCEIKVWKLWVPFL
ncbi:hypothetical protein L2E82_13518 [Cichorium intybus]|uniref:Uncharacterized protein n=1 Tax=Cichorium intybus TaxID=13427 RepID=A0ACB9EXX0_CICIN|nr:hypothetical protein L2E82_13518 [Cichorium intybus]